MPISVLFDYVNVNSCRLSANWAMTGVRSRASILRCSIHVSLIFSLFILPSVVCRLPFGQGTNEDFEPEPTIGEGNDGEGEGGLPMELDERVVIAKAYVWLINPFSRREGEQKPPLPRIFEKFRR